MTYVISCLNAKGGVSKTTTTLNLAYVLANHFHKKVLTIDWDSQASLTNCLNVGLKENEEYYGVFEFMEHELRPITPEEDEFLATCSFDQLLDACICRPVYIKRQGVMEDGKKVVKDVEYEFGFDLMPSHISLADYELELTQNNEGTDGLRLYYAIQKIIKARDYDYILIDCSPGMGLMNMNAIAAATSGVLIPTNLDIMSTRGVENLIEKVADVQTLLKEKKNIIHYGVIGVVLSLYSERRVIDHTIENNVKKFYPIITFETKIPESVMAKKAVYSGLLFSQVYKKAEDAYIKLAKEINTQMDVMVSNGQKILRLDPNEFRKIGNVGDINGY